MGRAIVSFFLSVLFVLVLAGIGVEVYQAGVTQGIVDAGRFPAGAAVPVAGYAGYHGFNIFGLIFPILFLFIIFGLLRAAFSHGRGWGRGYGRGYGWDGDWNRDDRERPASSWREERERRMADMHRRLHESEGSDPGSGGSSAPGGSSGAGEVGTSPSR